MDNPADPPRCSSLDENDLRDLIVTLHAVRYVAHVLRWSALVIALSLGSCELSRLLFQAFPVIPAAMRDAGLYIVDLWSILCSILA